MHKTVEQKELGDRKRQNFIYIKNQDLNSFAVKNPTNSIIMYLWSTLIQFYVTHQHPLKYVRGEDCNVLYDLKL